MLRVEQRVPHVSIHTHNLEECEFRGINWLNSNSKMDENIICIEILGKVFDRKDQADIFLSFDQAIELRKCLNNEIENLLQSFNQTGSIVVESDYNA